MKKIIKFIWYATIAPFCLILLLLLLFQTGRLQKDTIDYLAQIIHAKTSYHIDVKDAGGFFPLYMTSSKVLISHPEMEQVEINNVHLYLSPLCLMKGCIGISFSTEVSPSILPYAIKLEQVQIEGFIQANPKFKPILRGGEFFRNYLERGKTRLKRSGPNEELMAIAMGDKEDRSGEAAAERISKKLTAPQYKSLSGNFHIFSNQLNGQGKFVLLDNGSLDLEEIECSIYENSEKILKIQAQANRNSDGECQGSINFNMPQINALYKFLEMPFDGSIEGQFIFSGPIDDLTLTGEILGQSLEFDSNAVGFLSLKANAKITRKKVLAHLQLNGNAFRGNCKTIVPQKIDDFDANLSQLACPSHDDENMHEWAEKGTRRELAPKGRFYGVHEFCNCLFNDPLIGSADLLWEGSHLLHLSSINLTSPHLEVNGSLDYSLDSGFITGSMEGHIENLDPFSTLLDSPLAGSLDGRVIFNSDETQIVDLHLEFSHLAFRGNCKTTVPQKIDDFNTISQGQLAGPGYSDENMPEGAGEEARQEMASKGRFYEAHEFCNSLFNQFSIDKLHFTTTYRNNIVSPFTLTATGFGTKSSNLLSIGSWQTLSNGLHISLETLKANFGQEHCDLKQPFSCLIGSKQIKVTPIDLKIGSASFNAFFDSTPSETKGSIKAVNIPLKLMKVIMSPNLPVNGLTSFSANLHGTNNDLQGQIELTIDQIAIKEESFANLPQLKAKILGTIHEGSLELTGSLESNQVRPVTLAASIPLVFHHPAKLRIDNLNPINLKLAAEGEIAHLLRLFMENTISISGHTKAELNITGTILEPNVSGFAEIKNGSYEDLDTGAAFQNLNARLEGNHHEFVLTQMSADDGEKGSVTATGKIKIDPEDYFPFQISLDIKNAILVHLDYARATASGKVSLSGNFLKRTWNGELTIDKATVTIPEEAPPQLKAIEVTYLHLPESDGIHTQFKQKRRTASTHLNVAIIVPKRAYVNGKDLKSEWHGNISLTGNIAQPLLEGKLQIISGNYLFNGRSFVSRQGDIIFAGDPGKKTTLYIVAEQEIDRMKVEAILKGPIHSPKLSFRSNPPLSEKEILSWILFNRGLNDITPFQGAQLNQTVFTISGGKDSSDVLSKIRNKIGIDRIDISSVDTEESNEVSLRVGKYISRGVFVSLSRSINAEAHQIGIEAKMSRHIKVKGEVGDNYEGNMWLKWTNDY